MITYKAWVEMDDFKLYFIKCDGWFLFGFIPLYIRRITQEWKSMYQ